MDDIYFMKKALDLAKKGASYVYPNPMVGCVIVKDNKIISEGYHQYYGGNHAEVNAIKYLDEKNFKEWDKVTMYVTLEPCSHYGKTPPCSNLIIEKGIKNVVIATIDPNPTVSGNGIRQLLENDVCVKTGVLEKEAQLLNKRFFTYHQKKRPYIILKWAQTRDGYISRKNFLSREENIISSDEALKIVHQWRSEEQSILVGYNTVVQDNPQLNVRYVKGKNPVKIILDRNGHLDTNKYQVFQGNEKVIIFNTLKNDSINHLLYIKINWNNWVKEVTNYLYNLQILSVFVEGGNKTLQKFIDECLFDEIRIIKSKDKVFNEGVPALSLPQCIDFAGEIELQKDHIFLYKKI